MKLITKNGYDKLLNELDYLHNVKLPQVLAETIEDRENNTAKRSDDADDGEANIISVEQQLAENRIAELEELKSDIQIIEAKDIKTDTVSFGCKIKVLLDEKQERTYFIASSYESDVAQGIISIDSPLARECVGLKVGDVVDVNEHEYEILDISNGLA